MLELAFIAAMVLLGVRHALDLDHIIAIDNLVRLYDRDVRARLIGLSFSIGHVIAILAEISLIIMLIDAIRIDSIASVGAFLGLITLASICIINIYSLKRYGRNWASVMARKVIARFDNPLVSALVTGMVFVLAFDTASQISAIVLSSIASLTLGLISAFILAISFAVGMITIDIFDSMMLRSLLNRLSRRVYMKASYILSISSLVFVSLLFYEFVSSIDILPEWSGVSFAIASLLFLFILALNS